MHVPQSQRFNPTFACVTVSPYLHYSERFTVYPVYFMLYSICMYCFFRRSIYFFLFIFIHNL